MPTKDRTAPETRFINEYTRKLMVEWANVCLQEGELPEEQFSQDSEDPYVLHAFKKGWLTKRTPRRLTAGGWGTAAAFLKR